MMIKGNFTQIKIEVNIKDNFELVTNKNSYEEINGDKIIAAFPKPYKLKKFKVNAAKSAVVHDAKFDFSRESIVEAVYTEKI